jgi:hypothetical protein
MEMFLDHWRSEEISTGRFEEGISSHNVKRFVSRFVILSPQERGKNLFVWRVSQRKFFAALRMTPFENFTQF